MPREVLSRATLSATMVGITKIVSCKAMVRTVEAMPRKIQTVIRVLTRASVVGVGSQPISVRRMVRVVHGSMVSIVQAATSAMDSVIVSSANHHRCRTELVLKHESMERTRRNKSQNGVGRSVWLVLRFSLSAFGLGR